jgi:hypothetical protein
MQRALTLQKPNVYYKNIGSYAATPTYIHIRIPFNFSKVFVTKNVIAATYNQFLEKHEEPFKSIVKFTTDVCLITIEGSLEE